MKKLLIVFVLLLFVNLSFGQRSFVRFLVADEVKTYQEAVELANDVSSQMNIKLDLRGLVAYEGGGLTVPDSICKLHDVSYPAYTPRGRWDDGVYVSIEWSDDYEDVAESKYIVVVSSNSEYNNNMVNLYESVSSRFIHAYLQSTTVYTGSQN